MEEMIGSTTMVPSPPSVELIPFEEARDLAHLRVWLTRPHVSRWWGDCDEALAALRLYAPTAQAVITVDAHPVGYLCWQRLRPEDIAAAGLTDLPADLIDVDILIGERDYVGRGIGPRALTLLLDRLRAEGHTSVGIAAAAANRRAHRAYKKAGFRLVQTFHEAGEDMLYLVQSLDPKVSQA